MFRSRSHSSLQALDTEGPRPWGAKVRSAHALADLLKRTHPHLYEQISDFQASITRCHQTLADLQQQQQAATQQSRRDGRAPNKNALSQMKEQEWSALRELDATLQALLDLRHKGQMAK